MSARLSGAKFARTYPPSPLTFGAHNGSQVRVGGRCFAAVPAGFVPAVAIHFAGHSAIVEASQNVAGYRRGVRFSVPARDVWHPSDVAKLPR